MKTFLFLLSFGMSMGAHAGGGPHEKDVLGSTFRPQDYHIIASCTTHLTGPSFDELEKAYQTPHLKGVFSGPNNSLSIELDAKKNVENISGYMDSIVDESGKLVFLSQEVQGLAVSSILIHFELNKTTNEVSLTTINPFTGRALTQITTIEPLSTADRGYHNYGGVDLELNGHASTKAGETFNQMSIMCHVEGYNSSAN